MDDLFASVARDLSDAAVRDSMAASLSLSLPTLCEHIVTQDVVLPMGKHQIQGKNIASGGCTLLHLATSIACKRAIHLDPSFTYAYTLSGHEYVANEDFEKAISCYRHAIRTDARHYNAWYGLGTIYYRQEKFEFAAHSSFRAMSSWRYSRS